MGGTNRRPSPGRLRACSRPACGRAGGSSHAPLEPREFRGWPRLAPSSPLERPMLARLRTSGGPDVARRGQDSGKTASVLSAPWLHLRPQHPLPAPTQSAVRRFRRRGRWIRCFWNPRAPSLKAFVGCWCVTRMSRASSAGPRCTRPFEEGPRSGAGGLSARPPSRRRSRAVLTRSANPDSLRFERRRKPHGSRDGSLEGNGPPSRTLCNAPLGPHS
jgi:hypothetical protein